jgi:hypothetical protein
MAPKRSGTVRAASSRRASLNFENRVQVGAVGRQVAGLGAGRLDQPAHLGRLVAGEVVHHHDVAGPQRRHQAVADVGLEAGGIGGPVEDQAGGLGHTPRRTAAVRVKTFQCPCGTGPSARTPLEARP